jgi:hypothetical protein
MCRWLGYLGGRYGTRYVGDGLQERSFTPREPA